MNVSAKYIRMITTVAVLTLFVGDTRADASAGAASRPAASRPAPASQSQPAAVPAPSAGPREEPVVTRAADGRIDMHLRQIDVVAALTQLRRLERRNIIISTSVRGEISLDLYGVTFAEALQAILQSANLVAHEDGSFIYVCTPAEAAERFTPRRSMTSHVFPLAYVSAEEVAKVLQPLLSREGKISATAASQKGIATNKENAGGNEYASADTIVVVDYPENIERMKTVVSHLDVRPRQVLIEATILAASLRDDNALGVDFTALCGVDFRALTPVSEAGQNLALGEVPVDQIDRSTFSSNTNFTSALPEDGLRVGYIKNGIGVFLQALEQVTDTVVLANPKVLVLNKQRGEVMVGRRDGYLTTITTETTTIQNVEFLETGTRLIFRPYIGNDGFVRLEVHPEDSTGGLTEAGLPFEDTAEVTTNILVKDGTTVVIGGLFRDNTRVRRGQVPLLGEIPGLGAAFRRTRDEAIKQEVIVLLTPHVVDDPADERYARQLLDDAERIRVGARRGLQWHGRERLAQAYFRAAENHLRQGHRLLARWEADAALSMQPTFLEAIRLREQIVEHPTTEPAGSAIRDMVLRHIESQAPQTQPAMEAE